MTWLTPRRMRAATVALFAVAVVISSVGMSGSSTPVAKTAAQHAPGRGR